MARRPIHWLARENGGIQARALIYTIARAAACLLVVAALPAAAWAERLPIKVYTTADGLPSSVILAIVPDSRGFVWFATRNGLGRFDGSEFRTYTTDDGLSHPVVNDFLETRDGEYWVATNGGGVCRFNIGKRPDGGLTSLGARPAPTVREPLFTCRAVGSHFMSNRVNVLREDRQGRIWLGTDNGLFRLDRGAGAWRLEPVKLDGMPFPIMSIPGQAIHEDSKGRLWVGMTNGLLRLDPDRRARLYTVQGRSQLEVSPILERDGVLWVGLSPGLLALRPEPELPNSKVVTRHELNPHSNCVDAVGSGITVPSAAGDACLYTVRNGLPTNNVMALAAAPGGRIWIGTMGGLAYLDATRFTNLAAEDSRAGVPVSRLTRDRDGHLWIGTHVGAMKLTPDALVSYGSDDGLGHSRIHTLFEEQGGRLIAISGDFVINRFDGRRFQALTPQVPEGSARTSYSPGAFLDRTGRWWLLTNRGLYRLGAGPTIEQAARQPPEDVYNTSDGLPDDRIVRLFEDSRGDIWIASRSTVSAVGLSRWERATGTIRVFREGFGAAHQFPLSFVEDRRGAVWIGFEGGGLARYHDDRFTIFGPADEVPRDVIALYVDGSGRLWIASASAGLSMLQNLASDRPAFVRYTTAQGLSTNNIQCLTDDRWGRMYLGTARGVDRLDPTSGRVQHLTTSDGLAADYVTAAFRDRTGTIWFGTMDGLSRLVPTADAPSVPPTVWISEVRAGGVLQATPELGAAQLTDLTLEPAQNHLQIAFFGVGSGSGGPLRYRYRLDETDSDWSGPTDQRVVHYAGLGAGRYRFVVESLNADGVASGQPASVSFTVLSPIWQRWWFVSLTLAMLGAAAYLLHRVRVTRLLELERIRTRIAADLHDDIGGSLSRIAIQSEVARREVVAAAGTSEQRLTEIGDTARSVVESLADVVWSVDPGQDDLASVERRVREYAADVLGARGVRWTFHGTDHADRFALDPEARHDLLLLLKEGITNIARHAEARVASLDLRVVDNRLRAELRDDGSGFDLAALEADPRGRGHGLANMRQRVRQLGGTLEIDSQPGSGTYLAVSVPLRHLRRKKRMNMRLSHN